MLHNALPPVAPIDATLALHASARRAAVGPQHLLSSAPLLGRRVRRLSRGLAARPNNTPFRWRTQQGWRPGGGTQPARPTVAAMQSGATPAFPGTSVSQTLIQQVVRADGLSPLRAESTGGLPTSETVGANDPKKQSDAAHALAVAPSLVWFARWREMRVKRLVEERRAAPPAGDMLRSIAVHARIPQHAQVSPASGLSKTVIASSSVPATAMVQRAEWAPLAAVLRTRLTMPLAQERASATASRREETIGGPEATNSSLGTVIVPLVPSLGVATRAAARAAAHASEHATARAIQALNDALPKRVAAQVRHDVAQAVTQRDTSRSPSTEEPMTSLVDDRVVTLLLGRMRALLREEQFRHGLIR